MAETKKTRKTTKKVETEKELVRGITYDIEEPVQESVEKVIDHDGFYDEAKARLDLEGLMALSKPTQASAAFVNDKQIRIIIDNYYQTQHHRMNLANQIRAVKQGFDESSEGEIAAVQWMLDYSINGENQIKKMIAEYTKQVPVCQWAMAIKGIGPVLAANLWSYIDMNKCRHANQFLNYAGLNDNNAPWLGKEKSTVIVNDAYKKFGLKVSDDVTEDVLLEVATVSGRNVDTVRRGFNNHKERNSKKKSSDKTHLTNYLSKPPYNTDLKKVCFLIGESFVKVSNRGSLYGQIFKERKAWETARNERGEYADQAARLLSEKNYNKETETYKYLIEGKLSPAHINQRAKRYAVKIFLTHFFEACYIYTYGEKPPVIYPIAFQDHVDYIEPEVPYSDYINIVV